MADIAVSSGDKAPAGPSSDKPPAPGGGSASVGGAAAGGRAEVGRVTKAGGSLGSEELLGVSGGEEEGAARSEDAPAGEGQGCSKLAGRDRERQQEAECVPLRMNNVALGGQPTRRRTQKKNDA